MISRKLPLSGALIFVHGHNESGKSTVARAIVKTLRDYFYSGGYGEYTKTELDQRIKLWGSNYLGKGAGYSHSLTHHRDILPSNCKHFIQGGNILVVETAWGVAKGEREGLLDEFKTLEDSCSDFRRDQSCYSILCSCSLKERIYRSRSEEGRGLYLDRFLFSPLGGYFDRDVFASSNKPEFENINGSLEDQFLYGDLKVNLFNEEKFGVSDIQYVINTESSSNEVFNVELDRLLFSMGKKFGFDSDNLIKNRIKYSIEELQCLLESENENDFEYTTWFSGDYETLKEYEYYSKERFEVPVTLEDKDCDRDIAIHEYVNNDIDSSTYGTFLTDSIIQCSKEYRNCGSIRSIISNIHFDWSDMHLEPNLFIRPGTVIRLPNNDCYSGIRQVEENEFIKQIKFFNNLGVKQRIKINPAGGSYILKHGDVSKLSPRNSHGISSFISSIKNDLSFGKDFEEVKNCFLNSIYNCAPVLDLVPFDWSTSKVSLRSGWLNPEKKNRPYDKKLKSFKSIILPYNYSGINFAFSWFSSFSERYSTPVDFNLFSQCINWVGKLPGSIGNSFSNASLTHEEIIPRGPESEKYLMELSMAIIKRKKLQLTKSDIIKVLNSPVHYDINGFHSGCPYSKR